MVLDHFGSYRHIIVAGTARAALGPTAFDRVLAVNSIGTLAVLAICVYGFFDGRPEFLDIALLYALINFIGTICVLKYFRAGTLGDHVPPRNSGTRNDGRKYCDRIAIFSLGVGSLGVLFGALGLLRLGDVYQRMHGAGIIDTGGAGLILFGLLLASPDWTVSVRLVLIGLLLALTSPTATHAIARAPILPVSNRFLKTSPDAPIEKGADE